MHTLCLSVERSGSLLHGTFHGHMQKPIPSKAHHPPPGTINPSPRTHITATTDNISPRGPHHFSTLIPFYIAIHGHSVPCRSTELRKCTNDRPLISQFRNAEWPAR